mmetsp:Transcript_36769/g.66467  ORF Transcript_36769/g.66467 Transcript_36769/m.66467 type:complete len:438 (+) Transcript_36769:518-1831(+)
MFCTSAHQTSLVRTTTPTEVQVAPSPPQGLHLPATKADSTSSMLGVVSRSRKGSASGFPPAASEDAIRVPKLVGSSFIILTARITAMMLVRFPRPVVPTGNGASLSLRFPAESRTFKLTSRAASMMELAEALRGAGSSSERSEEGPAPSRRDAPTALPEAGSVEENMAARVGVMEAMAMLLLETPRESAIDDCKLDFSPGVVSLGPTSRSVVLTVLTGVGIVMIATGGPPGIVLVVTVIVVCVLLVEVAVYVKLVELVTVLLLELELVELWVTEVVELRVEVVSVDLRLVVLVKDVDDEDDVVDVDMLEVVVVVAVVRVVTDVDVTDVAVDVEELVVVAEVVKVVLVELVVVKKVVAIVLDVVVSVRVTDVVDVFEVLVPVVVTELEVEVAELVELELDVVVLVWVALTLVEVALVVVDLVVVERDVEEVVAETVLV